MFPTAIVPCRCGRQKGISVTESRANLVVNIDGGDGSQDGLERTESVPSFLWVINESDGATKYRALQGSLRNCNVSNESQRHNVVDTYLSMSLLARLVFL